MAPLSVPTPATTRRSRAKSDRRSQLIAAAERLVAERGYLAVRLEDIGAAVGVSGPAIYRHFPNKDALDGLIDFHLDFALGESDLIRIQDRDLGHLPPTAKRQVRRAQRQYVEIWVDVLRRLEETLSEADARLMAHATFGLLNSTPHSVKPGAAKTAEASSRTVLRAMTVAALTSAGRAGR